ncbi:MAG: hypothetical protein IAE95_06840 [Chitinophagaceae bacterium]|nr:hypothetical protein [Chitinophagaceae bacterium]
MQTTHYLVPAHTIGSETDIVCRVGCDSVDDASFIFVDAKDRLLAVTDWATVGVLDEVRFQLQDATGHLVRRHARRHDHILIVSGSAGQPTADHDAYVIEALEYDDYPDTDEETFAVRLKPVDQPDGDTDTTTIVVGRRGKDLYASYHGRNRQTNADDLWHGLTTAQWEALMSGLLRDEDDGLM